MAMAKTARHFYKDKKIMKLSISIMAHSSRAKYFPYLNRMLGDVKFSIDKAGAEIGVWNNCKRAWMMHDPKAEYHVVIQDDAIICENFRQRAEKILTSKEQAYNFYFGNRQQYRQAAKDGMEKGFIISGWTGWGVAICLPTYLIREMLLYCDKMRTPHDDTRIANFLKHKKIKTLFPMPSLIDHRTGEHSLVGDPSRGRKAWYFIDNENK
jgi:hypothetical protein